MVTELSGFGPVVAAAAVCIAFGLAAPTLGLVLHGLQLRRTALHEELDTAAPGE